MGGILKADDLMAGAALTHQVEVPARLLPGAKDAGDGESPGCVSLRPLTVGDVRGVARAAKGDGPLTSLLMLKQALVEPVLTLDQVSALPAGLVQFLLAQVQTLSGLALEPETLEAAVRDPMARACLVLAREFGWSASQCAELTVGQILVYLEMLGRDEGGPEAAAQMKEGHAA